MSPKILIVEDEAMVALDLEAWLEEFGYAPVGIAPDAATAYRLAATAPTLALVDLNLRDGLSGPEIGRRLAHEFGVRVLFMTANPRLLEPGIPGTLGVLAKPYEPQAVQAAIEFALERNPVAPPELRVFA
ncbi:MAG: response regulator [Methylobacterium sp.]|nr:MAG: response regulator [Methylobacterium sp.]